MLMKLALQLFRLLNSPLFIKGLNPFNGPSGLFSIIFRSYSLVFCLLGMFPAISQAADQLPIYQAEVLNVFPHDANAFTQGLIAVDGQLYEGTGRKGESSLRLVALENGELLKRHNLSSRYFGEGITLMGDKIYQLTWQAELAFIYQKETFELLESFYLPGEGWGITHDGSHLIVSDGTSFLRFIDPESLKEVKRVQVTGPNGPVGKINELEYINGEVWANIWYEDIIVRIDPETGRLNSAVDLRGLYIQRSSRDQVLNGIAWDEQNQRLFVTGKLWPNIYELHVKE